MTENEVEDKLTSFITVFKYIDDKDIFQKVTRAPLIMYSGWEAGSVPFCCILTVPKRRHSVFQVSLFPPTVLCPDASKAVNTRFIIVDGLRRSHDQQTKGTCSAERY